MLHRWHYLCWILLDEREYVHRKALAFVFLSEARPNSQTLLSALKRVPKQKQIVYLKMVLIKYYLYKMIITKYGNGEQTKAVEHPFSSVEMPKFWQRQISS